MHFSLKVLIVTGMFSQAWVQAQGVDLKHQISYSVDLSGLQPDAQVSRASALLVAGSSLPGCSEIGEGGWGGKTISVPLEVNAGSTSGVFQIQSSFKPGLCRFHLSAITVRADIKVNGVRKAINLGAQSAGALADHVPTITGVPLQTVRSYCWVNEEGELSCAKGVSQIDALFFPGSPNDACVGCTGFTFYTAREDSLKESVTLVLVASEAEAKERILREQPVSP